MSVYVDELPDSCYDCCCNNDDWKCRLTDSELPCKWDVRDDDCPLKVVVHCDKCIHNVGIRENTGFYEEDIVCDYWDCDGLCSWDYCSNGEKKDV